MSNVNVTGANELILAPASESWLSRHTPYILLLAFLFYCNRLTIGLFDDFFHFYRVLPLVEDAIIVALELACFGVLIRVAAYAVARNSWTEMLSRLFREPTWWRTWYPRFLRAADSVWGRLPTSLKLMRTLIWLELILLPAGSILAVFVLPTFQAVYASIGVQTPLAMQILMTAVEIGGYLLPVIAIVAIVQTLRWHKTHRLSLWIALTAYWSVNPS